MLLGSNRWRFLEPVRLKIIALVSEQMLRCYMLQSDSQAKAGYGLADAEK